MDISQISSTTQVPITLPANRQATSAPTGALPAILPQTNNGAAAAIQSATKAVPVDAVDLKRSIDAINKFLKPVASNIEFSIDQDSGRTLVKVVDTDTNTVIRQTPSKEVLAIAKELDKLQGLLIREKA
ncbi:MAG: flagellar protein FlaG [Pseudomonadota bacterium]